MNGLLGPERVSTLLSASLTGVHRSPLGGTRALSKEGGIPEEYARGCG
jgi:hypothetical protein